VEELKFCPSCGAKLKFEDAKFCSECGKSLSESVETKGISQKEYDEENLKASIFELGTKLEEVVEKIYRAKGYTTERRQRLMGESGTLSEIDVVAKKGSRTIAIECKNYSYPVGIDKLRDFNQKLQDLSFQGVFISLNGLTEGAAQFAQSQHIETMDSSELMEKWWRIYVGRGENVRGQSITLESALPLNISYLQATRIDLLNREKIKVSDAELIFHPYFSIEYLFKAQVKDPTRRLHKFEDTDTLFVDALDGRVLNASPEKGLGLLKAIKRITSEVCGQSLCDSHVKTCPICKKWLCEEDGIECAVCKNRFCKEHQLLSCSICNKPLCNSCAVVCPICGTKYGVDHVTTCDNCKRNICPNCVTITGFIRKTRTCKKCATQL
jgi:hypothetical protein